MTDRLTARQIRRIHDLLPLLRIPTPDASAEVGEVAWYTATAVEDLHRQLLARLTDEGIAPDPETLRAFLLSRIRRVVRRRQAP